MRWRYRKCVAAGQWNRALTANSVIIRERNQRVSNRNGASCKTRNWSHCFRNCSIFIATLFGLQRQVIVETLIDRAALSPSPPLAPGQFLRPPCTAWGPYRFGFQTYPPFCPPQSARAVDNSANHALNDSKVMRPSRHQAGTLRCKARPETGRRSGGDRLQDRQMHRQPVARQEMQ